jgi:hypothetical protein
MSYFTSPVLTSSSNTWITSIDDTWITTGFTVVWGNSSDTSDFVQVQFSGDEGQTWNPGTSIPNTGSSTRWGWLQNCPLNAVKLVATLTAGDTAQVSMTGK